MQLPSPVFKTKDVMAKIEKKDLLLKELIHDLQPSSSHLIGKNIPNTSNSKLYRELVLLMTEQSNSLGWVRNQWSGRTTSLQDLTGGVMELVIALAFLVIMELMYKSLREDL